MKKLLPVMSLHLNMDNYPWNNALLFDFIECYKTHECLWLKYSRHYYNRAAKKRAYEDLVSLVQEDFPNADILFVKKKIKNLRCAFRKAYKKQKISQRTEIGKIYEPKLWYFDLLMFTVLENDLETSISAEDDWTMTIGCD